MIRLLAAAMAAGLLATGCMSFSDRAFDPVKREIQAQAPGLEMRRDFAISVGSVLLNTVDLIAIDSDFDFSSVDRVRVAVYEVAYDADLQDLDMERSLASLDPGLHWEAVVRVREHGENVWVMVGIDENRGTVDAVTVMVMERSELVLIHVKGELNDMIEFAFDPVRGRRGGFSFS